jgi:hypothetical protein
MSLRTDRRRLLLADELLNASTEDFSSAREPLPAVARGRYASAAERDNQPRMIDFVPLRPWSMSLTIGLGAAIITALLLAYAWLAKLAAYVPAEALTPLDLTTNRCLANWFASLLLLANAQLSLVIYSLRKHRVDDYHGRYRIWLWIAMASLFASMELATGISRLVKAALSPAARLCGVAEQMGLLAVLGLLACYLTVRAVLETRRSPATLLGLVLSGGLLLASAMFEYRLVNAGSPEVAVLIRSGTHLAGCLFLLIAAMFYSRHVMLDVEGKLPPPKPKQSKPAKAKKTRVRKLKTDLDSPEQDAAAKKVIVDPPQKPKPHLGARTTDLQPSAKAAPAPKPTFVPSKPQSNLRPQAAEDSDDDETSADSSDPRSLSRAERKRLKREAKLARR